MLFLMQLMSGWLFLGMAAGAVDLSTPGSLSGESPSEPSLAWRRVVEACEDPSEGKAIRGRRITGEERLRLRASLHPGEWRAADLAATFRTQHPAHPNAAAALRAEVQQLILIGDLAVATDTNLFARVQDVVRELIRELRLSERERFTLAAAALNRAAYARFSGVTNAADTEALLDVELSDARFLRQAFPAIPEIWNQLQLIAGHLPPVKARPVLDDILSHAPEGAARDKAAGLMWRLDAQGTPFQLSFSALDGKRVDTSSWAGKVVLLDFWATWCGPCVAKLPELRQVYDRHHSSGLEVIGISLDTDRHVLDRFITKQGLPWPQYCDELGWNSKWVVRYGVSLVPSLWLVDKKGVLRYLDAREGLETKVEALLRE